jgi:hypothetical protein
MGEDDEGDEGEGEPVGSAGGDETLTRDRAPVALEDEAVGGGVSPYAQGP